MNHPFFSVARGGTPASPALAIFDGERAGMAHLSGSMRDKRKLLYGQSTYSKKYSFYRGVRRNAQERTTYINTYDV